jgi:NitT/TauT family transport system substrate-binding protein
MTGKLVVHAGKKGNPSRRAALKHLAGAGLIGAGISRPRPARAATKVRVLTYFLAEPTQAGFFQAAATGLYEKAGLDVEIKQGGPQLNGMMLLAGGETDFFMGSGIAVLNSIDRNVPVIAIAAPLQFDLQVIVTRPDIRSFDDLKGRKILVTAGGRAGYWHWLKARYGFTEDQVAPYTGNFQPFVQDPTIALGASPPPSRTASVKRASTSNISCWRNMAIHLTAGRSSPCNHTWRTIATWSRASFRQPWRAGRAFGRTRRRRFR